MVLLVSFCDELIKLSKADCITGIRKSQELSKIRKIYIPELIFRLHFTLIETSSIIPTNLTRALALSNIVADEKYSLYLEFITPERNRIGEYLLAVREAKLKAVGPKL